MQHLPIFRHHPDPVATGAVVAKDGFVCGVCNQARSHAYIAPYWDKEDRWIGTGEAICPWCIADGSAARLWGAVFNPLECLSAAVRATLPAETLDTFRFRTPHFLGITEPEWLDHHGEPAAYLGEVDFARYLTLPPQAQKAVRQSLGDAPNAALRDSAVHDLTGTFEGLHAFLFGCLHCGCHGAIGVSAGYVVARSWGEEVGLGEVFKNWITFPFRRR